MKKKLRKNKQVRNEKVFEYKKTWNRRKNARIN